MKSLSVTGSMLHNYQLVQAAYNCIISGIQKSKILTNELTTNTHSKKLNRQLRLKIAKKEDVLTIDPSKC